MARSNLREKVQLRSTGVKKDGKSTGYFKTTLVNKRKEKKLEIKMYDPRAHNAETGKTGMHVIFKQKKIAK
jgi:large subunit ribosomal protein L33